jgi:hypothetical protein
MAVTQDVLQKGSGTIATIPAPLKSVQSQIVSLSPDIESRQVSTASWLPVCSSIETSFSQFLKLCRLATFLTQLFHRRHGCSMSIFSSNGAVVPFFKWTLSWRTGEAASTHMYRPLRICYLLKSAGSELGDLDSSAHGEAPSTIFMR